MTYRPATAMIEKAVATRFAPTFTTKLGPTLTPVPAGTSATEGRRRYLVEVSDPGLDKQRDRVLRGAIDTNTPPVPLLISHDHSGLPIGMVGQFHYGPNGKLRGTMSLPPAGISARADEVAGLAEHIGFQLSIGGEAEEAAPNREGGYDISKFVLREISIVPVGAAIGTGVLASVKQALAAKGTMTNDGEDPTRDPVALRSCPLVGTGCPKRVGQLCAMAAACPLTLGGSGTGGGIGGAAKRLSAFDKRAIAPVDQQLGHNASSERERGAWAWSHGKAAMQARQRDAETRGEWDRMKQALLAMETRERPTLRPFVDIDRATVELMPIDVKALVFGHLDVDSDLNDA